MRASLNHQSIVLALALVVACSVFALDLLFPADIAVWGLYLFPVFIMYQWAKGKRLYLVTLVCTALIFLGLFFPFPATFAFALVDRGIEAAVLWIFTMLLSRRAQAEENLHIYEGSLERQVRARTIVLKVQVEERKRAQRARKESEQLFTLMSEILPAAQILSRLNDNVVIYTNPAAADLLGLAREHMIGRDASEFYAQPDLRAFVVEQITQGNTVRNMQIPFKHASGKISWCLYSAIGGTFQGEPIVLAVAIDITERKRLEQALNDSEKRYRLLADNSYDMVWTMGAEGKITYMSPAVQRIRGYTPEETIGQTLDQIVTPASLPLVKERLSKQLAAGAVGTVPPPRPFICEQPCKDGSTVWTETICKLLFDDAGNFNGILAATRDISERRQVETRLSQSEARFASDRSL